MEQILQIPGVKTIRLQNHWKFSGFAGPIIIKVGLSLFMFVTSWHWFSLAITVFVWL